MEDYLKQTFEELIREDDSITVMDFINGLEEFLLSIDNENEYMKKEIWKDIKNYEGLYQVSNLGRVKSLYYNKILQNAVQKDGYFQVSLSKNGIQKMYLVHRLVAEAFLPNPHNYLCVNHKDEDKSNNIYTNLEWCDVKYNANYGTRNKRISKSNTNGKLSKPVLQYTLDGQFVKEWSSTMECGRNGYHQGTVAQCCRGELKKHKGYMWRYK